jgi:DNA-binding winged helix-turn-helix (wHTH) protein/TolB-like protein
MSKSADSPTFTSGDLRIFPDRGYLETDTQELRLGPVNMKVLVELVQREGIVVSREELFDQVWPNQVVSDETLTKCISDIRTGLASLSADRNFIRTVPKKGYQWLAVQEQAPKQLKPTASPGLVAALALATVVLFSWWLLNPAATNQTSIALLPIRADSSAGNLLARELEDQLRAALVKADGIAVLSSETVNNLPANPFSYLRSEFGAKWALEGRVHTMVESTRVTLSLVDADTAIVIYTRIGEFTDAEQESSEFVDYFSAEVHSIAASR